METPKVWILYRITHRDYEGDEKTVEAVYANKEECVKVYMATKETYHVTYDYEEWEVK